MSRLDHPPDDQGDVLGDTPDAAPDARGPVSAAGADRGTVLTDTRTRQEYALAYRATVDAIYARAERAEREVSRRGADQSSERLNIVDKYPDEYQRPTHDPPQVDAPHEQPEKWLRDINFDAGQPGRRNNSGECSRAVYSTWYGMPKAAAAMADARSGGEPTDRMGEWVGQRPIPASMAEIGQRLTELGHGSSAIVGCDWKESQGGHWFNAVNDGGVLKTVDGQRNRVGSWPPVFREVRFDESLMRFSDATFFDPTGKVVAN